MRDHRFIALGAAAHLAAALLVAAGCQPPGAAPTGQTERRTAAPPPPPPPPSASGGQSDANTSVASAPQAQLLADYRAAHARRDVAAVLKLYYFGSASRDMRDVTRENIEHQLRHPLSDISIAPVSPDHPQMWQEGEVRLRSSLPEEAIVTVRFDISRAAPGEWAVSEATFPVGTKGGRCYFTVPVRAN